MIALFTNGRTVSADKELPPVIITQVELSSPYVLAPDNMSCNRIGPPVYSHNCLENLVPTHKVLCEYFLGTSPCQPLHQIYNSTKPCASAHYSGVQWFTVYNRLDEAIEIQQFDGSADTVKLGPYQSCDYTFSVADEALPFNTVNESFSITYYYNGQPYSFVTPSLNDTFGDSRTWQFDGNGWVFAEQNTVSVPEFPFAIPILLISFASIIVIYRIRLKQ